MAAETVTATRGATTFPVFKASGAGVLCQSWGTYAVAADMEDGDIFEMSRVPGGAVVTGGYLHMEDIDAGIEEHDVMIGWAANGSDIADPDGLLLAGIKTGDISVHLDVASVFMPYGGVILSAGPKTLVNETIIQVEANDGAKTFGAGQMSTYTNYLNP